MLKLAKASHIYLKITFGDILCLYCGFYINATNTHIFNHNEHFAFIYCDFAYFACIYEDNRILPQLASRNSELFNSVDRISESRVVDRQYTLEFEGSVILIASHYMILIIIL